MTTSACSSSSGWRLRSTEVVSSPSWMLSSRSARRVSSDTSAPSRAYGAIPAEATLTWLSIPRSRSSRRSICSAITLRAVFAAQIINTERKRGPLRAALSPYLLGDDSCLDATGHHLSHALFLGRALGEFLLELRTEFVGIPDRLLLDAADRMPSLHQPHRAHADAEHFAMHILRVVAAEPRHQRCDVSGPEGVEFAGLRGRHARGGLRSRIDGEAGARDRRDRVGGDAVTLHLTIDDNSHRGHRGLRCAVVALARVAQDAGIGAGVDEAAVEHVAALMLFAPVGACVARDVEAALQMHRDDRIPVFLVHVEDHPVAQDAGIVDHDVELAEVIGGAFDDALGGFEIGHALEVGDRFAAGGADFLDHVFGG